MTSDASASFQLLLDQNEALQECVTSLKITSGLSDLRAYGVGRS